MQIGGGNAPGIPRDVFVGGRTSSESGGTAGWGRAKAFCGLTTTLELRIRAIALSRWRMSSVGS